jgi:hypothetical protein
MHPMAVHQNRQETYSVLMQCITEMCPDSSIIHVIPTWPFIPLCGMAIIVFTIWQCLQLDLLSLTKSYVLIIKLKRELKFDNNVFVAKGIVEDGYLEIDDELQGSSCFGTSWESRLIDCIILASA